MAVGYSIVGHSSGSGSSIAIPLLADVPRTSPLGGGTILVIFWQTSYGSTAAPTTTSDDATPQDVYSYCLYEDGLNHYDNGDPNYGRIVNDLTTSNTITMNFSDVSDNIETLIIALTGVDLPVVTDGVQQAAEAPFGAPTASSLAVTYGFTFGGTPVISAPLGASTDQNWDWVSGDVAFYIMGDNTSTDDQLGWTWSDGALTNYWQWDVFVAASGRYMSLAVAVQDPVTPGAQGPSIDGGWGSGGNKFLTGGNGIAFKAGLGPPCTDPPILGYPVFNHRFRAGAAGD